MSRKEWTRRFLLFLLNLFFTAMGVALTKHGSLGVSPISSVGNVMSCRFPALSLGNWLILWNCLLILGQMLLLGRRFRAFQLLQLPLSFLFSWFTDFGMWCVAALGLLRHCGAGLRGLSGGDRRRHYELRRGLREGGDGPLRREFRQREGGL